MKLGTKVRLSPSMVRWYINHQDIFFTSIGTVDPEYEICIQQCLAELLGSPVFGKVDGHGSDVNTYRVTFNTPFGKRWAYYNKNHLVVCG